MRRAALLATAVAVTLAAPSTVAPAGGDTVKYERIKTRIVFEGIDVHGSETTFFGRLKSRKPACVKRRRGLYVHKVGDLGVVGNDRSDRKGRWSFIRDTAGLDDGEYDATIRAALIVKNGEKKFKCRGGAGTFVTDDFPGG